MPVCQVAQSPQSGQSSANSLSGFRIPTVCNIVEGDTAGIRLKAVNSGLPNLRGCGVTAILAALSFFTAIAQCAAYEATQPAPFFQKGLIGWVEYPFLMALQLGTPYFTAYLPTF